MIAGVVLAAGRSARLGQPKQLLPYQGRPLLAWTLATLRESALDRLYVVLGHAAAQIQAEVDLQGAQVILNPHFADGLSTSLHAAVTALEPYGEIAAIVVTVGDQPMLSVAPIDALLGAYATTGAPLLAADYGTHRGTPLLIDRLLWPLLLQIDGDRGAHALIQSQRERLVTVAVSANEGLDIDTWDDYAQLNAQ